MPTTPNVNHRSVSKSHSSRLIAQRNFSQIIADELQKEIEHGVYNVGDRLPTESMLAATYGVSRAVVREALSALRQEAIVESFQGKGIFVANSSKGKTFRLSRTDLTDDAELKNILEFMVAHEVAAAALAAMRRTERQLRDIKYALDAMALAIANGDAGIEEDMAFHQSVVAATANPYFVSFHAFLEDQVRYLMRVTRLNSQRVGLTDLVQAEHQRIYAAIASENPSEASAAAESHLRNAAARMKLSVFDKG